MDATECQPSYIDSHVNPDIADMNRGQNDTLLLHWVIGGLWIRFTVYTGSFLGAYRKRTLLTDCGKKTNSAPYSLPKQPKKELIGNFAMLCLYI